MTQFTINAQDAETSSRHAEIRGFELSGQSWDRKKSTDLAQNEGIRLTDEHWAVILYLRSHYIEQGLPEYARTLAKTLKQQFSTQGGNKYLYRLFPGGPVTQGSRLANLRTPANVTDVSFGSSY